MTARLLPGGGGRAHPSTGTGLAMEGGRHGDDDGLGTGVRQPVMKAGFPAGTIKEALLNDLKTGNWKGSSSKLN